MAGASPVRNVSPPAWAANGSQVIPPLSGTTLPPVQIAGARPGRQTVTIVNIGANSAQLQSSQESSIVGVTLAAGGVWDIDTEGTVWATSAAGTTLDVLETWTPRDAGEVANLRPGMFAGQLQG